MFMIRLSTDVQIIAPSPSVAVQAQCSEFQVRRTFGRIGGRTTTLLRSVGPTVSGGFTQLGNVRRLDHGPGVLEEVWIDQTMVCRRRPLRTRQHFGTLLRPPQFQCRS